MSLESALTAIVSPIFAGKFNWDVLPDGGTTNVKFCIAQQVGGKEDWYIDKDDEKTHRHARIQFDIWSKTRAEASALAKQLSDAIRAMPHATEAYGAPVFEYQEDLKLYGARQDFGIWYPFADGGGGP